MAAPASSSELLLPPQGAGVAFIRRELRESTSTRQRPRETFRVEESSVLGRARSFLPQLAAAEGDLLQRVSCGPPSELDIENVQEDEPHIEMDLALVPLIAGLSSGHSCSSSEGESEGEEGEMVAGYSPLRLPGQRKGRTAGIEELCL